QNSATSGGTRPARPSAGPRSRVGSGASLENSRFSPSKAYAATALSLRLARAQRARRCGASQATPRPRARATWSRSAATSRRPRFTPCPAQPPGRVQATVQLAPQREPGPAAERPYLAEAGAGRGGERVGERVVVQGEDPRRLVRGQGPDDRAGAVHPGQQRQRAGRQE